MNPKPISEARDPDIRGAYAALLRAAKKAQQLEQATQAQRALQAELKATAPTDQTKKL